MNTTVKSNGASANVRCPVCGSPSDKAGEAPGWGEWRRCRVCTLEFADPLRLGHDPKELFDDAYRGKVQLSAMRDFKERVDQRDVILHKLHDPSLWFWTPAFTDVLDWLKQRFRPGSTVLELGCGLGWFLHAMRNEGFNAVGLDVAETVVELNRKDGFQVWHGTLQSMPTGWVKPDAVVSFFMLHHLDDPIGFLKSIREKAPGAPVAIAVYGPSNKRPEASEPPRTLIRWNSKGLARALEEVGYKPTTVDIPSTGVEGNVLQPIRRALGKTMAIPPVYKFGKRIEAAVLPKMPEQAKHDAYVVVAFGDPVEG